MPNAPPTSPLTTRSFSTGTPMRARHVLPHGEGALRGDVQHVAVALGFLNRQPGARLHRRHGDALVDEPDTCDVGRAGKDAVEASALAKEQAEGLEHRADLVLEVLTDPS